MRVEVIEAVLPRQLVDDIGPKQGKINEQERYEALRVADINKVHNKLLGCDNSIYIELVMLRE